MNICIIAYSRVGGTCFGEWLSREINRKYIHEPFNNHSVNKKIDFKEGNFVIKLEPEQIHMIPDNTIKISIIRENIYECAISNLHSIKTNKWHSIYTIDENWIDEHREELYKLEKNIKNQNDKIKNMNVDISITYEGIYNTKIDLEKIKNYFNISNTKYEYMLNVNNRYRNEKYIKKLI
jgi:hypothetical protein